jgi:hypothetical protein
MKAPMRILGAVGCLALLAPAAAPAQQQTAHATWREMLESRVRPAYRHTHPATPGECGAAPPAAAAYLAAPENARLIGRTWAPGIHQSRWEPFAGPARPDTLAVRIVDLWCAPAGRSVLVEADGYFLEIGVDQLARVDANGRLTPGILLMEGPGGARVQLALEERCAGETCRPALTDAESLAGSVQLELTRREEAERRERLEAQRRAEAASAARLRAGAEVRARTDGVTQRQRMEQLQSYGVTEEQVRAILAGRVLPGMTPAMVRAALGEPTSTRQEGIATVWVYSGQHVVLEGGRVIQVR